MYDHVHESTAECLHMGGSSGGSSESQFTLEPRGGGNLGGVSGLCVGALGTALSLLG